MRPPRKAFILAAGFGTRLRPLTLETPKPMLPLWNRPMLERTLEQVASWGVQEVLINLHHAPGPIVRHLARRPLADMRVAMIFEPVILGTGGALRHARWFLDQPFWLVNADVVADLDPRPLLRVWERQRPLAACWLTEDAGPKTVRCRNGVIRSFHDPANGQATFCGVQVLDPRILPFIRPEGFDTIIAAYQRAQKKRHSIAGVVVPGSFWADIGTPAQYVQAHRDTAARLGHAGESFSLPAAAVLSPREQHLVAALRRRLASPSASATPPRPKKPRARLPHPPPDRFPVEVVPPRGSARAFFRFPLPSLKVRGYYNNRALSAILIRWSPERPENRLYARHTRFLETLGLPVPRLLLDAPRDRVLILEDLGPDTLESRLPQMNVAAIQRLYRRLISLTLRLHQDGLSAARQTRLPLMPGFGPALYAWEHRYFCDHVLRARLGASESVLAAVAAELMGIAQILAASPVALIHRDWQSSNILFRGAQPVMIDYQGMRRGPAAYDLASLVCDPYADLPPPLQRRLVEAYARRHPQGDAIAAVFPAAVIQRLCQALGAYAVLSQQPGLASFARHIPVAARHLRGALAAQPHPLPALDRVANQLAET
ncbi:MAG: sugar phosphate nucleotidyltransferase [Kiritimatiellia bacterium]|jgi:aminoglycoside/choline kinase family phosphotransferase/dTDP-glucose pyrophosphorylase|nr:sugar phosphate nucleotidyltransferase [Kiritimatiellia bacterium]